MPVALGTEPRMTIELLSDEIRSRLRGTCLFYPCSGRDLAEPVRLFAPFVKSFWFADISYFPVAGSVHRAAPALAPSTGLEFVSAEIRENLIPECEWIDDPKYARVAPCIRAETYRHPRSAELIVICRHRRRGPSALRSLHEPVGVFFYRGDSGGEGGSGTLWLTVSRRGANVFLEVLDRLVDGGLIVTDGSNCLPNDGHNPYRHFAEAAEAWARESACEDFSFRDPDGRYFRLLGRPSSLWDRPTLMWQMSLSAASTL
jgi:hypothetical protein